MAMTGPTRTANDLIEGVLKELKVKQSGQPTDPEDFAYVSEELDSVMAKLGALNIVYIPDPDVTPAEYYRELVSIIAGEVCLKFGVNDADFVMLKNSGLGGVQGVDVGSGAAAKTLREMARGRPTYERLRVEYL
jgi:hypothetical protein